MRWKRRRHAKARRKARRERGSAAAVILGLLALVRELDGEAPDTTGGGEK